MPSTAIRLFIAALLLLPGLLARPAAAEDLMDIYRQAKQSDPEYRAALARFGAAQQSTPMALAGLLPSLTATGGYGWSRFEKTEQNQTTDQTGEEGQDSSSVSVQNYTTRRYGITLSQPLLSPQDWANYSRASAHVRLARALLVTAHQDLILRVARRYFAVLAARDELAYIRSERQSIGQSRRRAAEASRLGLISGTEQQRAQASHDLIIARELSAQHHLATRREELRELTGRMPDELVAVPPTLELSPLSPVRVERWTSLALKHNMELRARRHAVDEALLELRRRQAGFLPTLNMSASHSYSDDGGGRLPGEDRTGALMLDLRVPIFQGGMVLAQTREARYMLAGARQDYERQRRIIVSRVRNTHRAVLASVRRAQALRQAERSSAEVVRASQQGFELGANSFIEVLEALRELYQARRDLSRARHDYLLSRLEMAAAVGDLDEKRLRAINALLTPTLPPRPAAPKPGK